MNKSRILTIIGLLLVVWVVLAVIGIIIKGLFWLFIIGLVLFLLTMVVGGARSRR